MTIGWIRRCRSNSFALSNLRYRIFPNRKSQIKNRKCSPIEMHLTIGHFMPSLTLEQAFEMAVQHQQAGRPADAEAMCRQIVAYKPDHAEALHLLGILGHRAGHAE